MLPPREHALVLFAALVGACSLQDMSYLQQGESGSSMGGNSEQSSSSSAGKNNAGGSNSGAGSSNKGGTGNLLGSSAGGKATGGSATGGVSAANTNSLGPWGFDNASELAADWHRARVGVTVDWVPQGQIAPLGSMRIDATAKGTGEAQHDLATTLDGTNCSLSADVRIATGSGTLQLYAIDAKFNRGNEVAVPVDDTAWKTLNFSLASPASTSGPYNMATIATLGISLGGALVAWVDKATLVCNGTGGASAAGAGGNTGTGGSTRAGGSANSGGQVASSGT